jgi:ubiquinone/menaquinone biosynthesis C-methylase UbiE
MGEAFVSDEEYPTYFVKLEGMREKVAAELQYLAGDVLDVATGSAYFAMALARRHPDIHVTAIDIDSLETARGNVNEGQLSDRVTLREMDASSLEFQDESFDQVVNFLGLEDIHMTRGREGVERAFKEAHRVLRPGGSFCFVAMPSDEAETPAQRNEIEVFSWICDATWLTRAEYMTLVSGSGLTYEYSKVFRTGKRLTVEQAREEIAFACDNVPRIYDRPARGFDEAWERFGDGITEHGMGHYSRLELFATRKKPKRL